MDGKTTLLAGILAFILIGGGFLTLVIDNSDQDDDNSDNDTGSNEQSDMDSVVDVKPILLVNNYSKIWDSQNITLSGFLIDESPSSCIINFEVLDFNLVKITEAKNVSVAQDGSWSIEFPVTNPGEWIVRSSAIDESGQESNVSTTEMKILAPQENDIVITFLWDEPADNSSIGVLSGVTIHRFPETCSIEYRPKFQSPTLDVTGILDNSTGSYTIELDTDTVNANGTIFATCGLFSVSSSMIEVILPVPPEPAGDADLDGILDDEDQCDSTPSGEPVYDTGCSDSETDDDLDGVMNSDDQCPNTPQGETVDFTGCSLSQKDSDGDGVSDALDTCPNTPVGEIADSVGCSDSQKDSDGDGVNDALDNCPNTPVGDVVGADGCTLPDWAPEDSWYCQDGNGPWVKDDNGDGNNYNANTRGDGQEGGGGGSGPWFQCAVSVSVSSSTMNVNSNGIPNHDWMSTFGPGDEQSHTWSITLNPTNDTNGGHNSANCPASNGRWECAPDRGSVAIAANGVPIFGPEEGPGGDAVALDFFYFDEDRQPIELGYCGAHSGPTGVHYHWDAMCQYWEPESGQTMKDYDWSLIDSTQHSPVIGWSFDGYPIYGMYTWDDNGVVKGMKSSYQVERTNEGGDQGYNGIDDWNYVEGLGDLDECNGRFGPTPEYPQGTYYYVSTPLSGSTTTVTDTNGDTVPMIGFPYFQLCYHGIADTDSNAGGGQGGGGGGGGGGPGGFAAQTIYSHMPELLSEESESSDFMGLFWDVTWIWLAIVGLTLIKRKKS
jgi:hypothetical protein